MKSIALLTGFTILSLNLISQDTVQSKTYKNEFGVDATGFIKQVINFGYSEYPAYYSPSYYLTYRRHIGTVGNIRFAFGGAYGNSEISSPVPNDDNKYENYQYSINSRIGWEFYNELSKRWQVFYGLDFRPSYSYSKNDAPFWNGGYANGAERTTTTYGVAPLLGFRFRLTDRISLLTETSLALNWQESKSRRYFIPVDSSIPEIPDVNSPKSRQLSTSFSQPISIFITFDI